MMALAIAQVTVPFFGLYGLSLLLNSGLTKDQLKTVLKHGAIAIGIVLGIAALVLFMADFSAPGDKELVKNNYPIEKIKSIRNSKAFGDLFRSFLLIGVSFGLIFMYLLKNGSKVMLMAGMVVLVAFDLIGVSKRYLKEDNWIDKQEEETIAASQKEQQLMKFNTNHARVFDLRYNPFNDAHSAPWFRGIGGYHPAKLSRYQDLISYCITPNGGQLSFDGIMKNNALDMLNCGYVLTPGKESRDPNGFDVIPRTTALGNAWFVQKIVTVSSAKEAIETINKFKPSEEAVVEAKATAKPASATYSKDSTSAIVVTYYSYDTIEYKSKNAGPGFGVFSEIYYNQKNANWEASIDGKPATVLQVNYMLRGLEIPAGEHKIKFVYKSNSNPYINVERASSGILLLLLLVSLGKGITGKQESESGDA